MSEEDERYKLENLVVLQYARDNSYVNVVDAGSVEDNNFNISLEKGVWNYRHNFGGSVRKIRTFKIGESRIPIGGVRNSSEKWGIIGVYDRTKTNQLSSMAKDSINAVKERKGFFES